MTINEASERYKIPVKILREYESWGLCGEVKKVMGSWHYDENDLERLSTIMTLHDIGFIPECLSYSSKIVPDSLILAVESYNILTRRQCTQTDVIE